MADYYLKLPASSGGAAGVSSLNSLTGALNIIAGSGITITPAGSNITIAATGGGTGTVTSVSVVNVNGLSGSVATATTTPAITLAPTFTGIAYSNGTGFAPAIAANFPTLNQNTTGTALNITASSNSSLTTLSALSLPVSQLTGVLPIINGGTNSGTTLTNNKVIISTAGALVESSTTSTQLSFLDATSSIQTQLNAKQASGNYITALAGDVVATGPGSVSSAIQANVVTNAKAAQMFALTIKGNNTGATANAADLTAAQVNAILPVFTSTLNGLTPLSGGGTTNFLRADGTWAAVTGSSPLTTKGDLYGFDTANNRIPVGTNGQVLTADSTQALGVKWAPALGTGTVTSVALSNTSDPIYTITGSPITTAGTINLGINTQVANTVFAGPTSGGAVAPTFRAIVSADIPTLNQNTTGTALNITATNNSTLTTLSALSLPTSQLSGSIVLSTQVSGILSALNGGTGVTTSTGSGSNVLSTSPTLVTPVLGTPTSVTLTNATGLPLTSGVSGVLPIANGGTNSSTVLINNKVIISTAGALVESATTTTQLGFLDATSSIQTQLNGKQASGTYVTSVGLADTSTTPIFNISGSPVTTTGTLTNTLKTQTANLAFIGPASGAAAQPTFRQLQSADISGLENIMFGDGSDGTITISSGTTTLTKDMYYSNLTISGTGSLDAAGYRIFVLNTLTLDAAPAGAIKRTPGAGGAGSNNTGGTPGTALSSNTVAGGGGGSTGAGGGTGVGPKATQATGQNTANGGAGGIGSVGGTGVSVGGTLTSGGTVAGALPIRRFTTELNKGIVQIVGGAGGTGGSAGGGDGTISGGGAGGGGGGGGVVFISARIISRTGSTTASAITSAGGAGGAGGSRVSGTNVGGGAGGGGGGGGWLYLVYEQLAGTTATNILDSSGGAGGTGGSGFGTGLGATGGGSGSQGRITVINLTANTSTDVLGSAGVAGTTNSGAVGGAGAPTNTLQSNL